MKYNILKAQSGTKIPLSPRYKNYPKPKYQGEIKKDETSQLERSIDNLYRDKIKSTPFEGIIKTIVPSAAIASGAAAGPILTTAKGVATAAGYGALQGLGFGQLGMGSGSALNDASYGAAGEVAGPLVGKAIDKGFTAAKQVGTNILKKKVFIKGPLDITLKTDKNKLINKYSIPNQNIFKSEIDWGNWNKEIPSNKPLMDEYLQIEKTSKQNGTWMKNPDGTDFPGTPEQFVQQNSSNFKNAFGNTKVLVNGRPQILTHNSPDIFSEFSLNKINNGRLSGDGVYTFEEGALWKGIPEHLKKIIRYPAKIEQPKYGKIEYHLYGNSTNPKIGKGQFDDITKDMVKDNPTSTRVIDDINRKNIHVFPNTNQLKSAIGNNGMFDMTNPNIYKSLIGGAFLNNLINNLKEEHMK